jgi:hypothetical protein
MSHPVRKAGNIPDAVQEFVSSQKLQLHQIVAATHPEIQTKRLAAKSRRIRQALERRINDQLSKPVSNKH